MSSWRLAEVIETRQNVVNTMLNFFFTFPPTGQHNRYHCFSHVGEADQNETTALKKEDTSLNVALERQSFFLKIWLILNP